MHVCGHVRDAHRACSPFDAWAADPQRTAAAAADKHSSPLLPPPLFLSLSHSSWCASGVPRRCFLSCVACFSAGRRGLCCPCALVWSRATSLRRPRPTVWSGSGAVSALRQYPESGPDHRAMIYDPVLLGLFWVDLSTNPGPNMQVFYMGGMCGSSPAVFDYDHGRQLAILQCGASTYRLNITSQTADEILFGTAIWNFEHDALRGRTLFDLGSEVVVLAADAPWSELARWPLDQSKRDGAFRMNKITGTIVMPSNCYTNNRFDVCLGVAIDPDGTRRLIPALDAQCTASVKFGPADPVTGMFGFVYFSRIQPGADFGLFNTTSGAVTKWGDSAQSALNCLDPSDATFDSASHSLLVRCGPADPILFTLGGPSDGTPVSIPVVDRTSCPTISSLWLDRLAGLPGPGVPILAACGLTVQLHRPPSSTQVMSSSTCSSMSTQTIDPVTGYVYVGCSAFNSLYVVRGGVSTPVLFSYQCMMGPMLDMPRRRLVGVCGYGMIGSVIWRRWC